MGIVYNKIIQSEQEPSPQALWIKDGMLKYYQGGWNNIISAVEDNYSVLPFAYTTTVLVKGTSADNATVTIPLVDILKEDKNIILIEAASTATDNSVHLIDTCGNTIVSIKVNKYSQLQSTDSRNSKIKIDQQKLQEGNYKITYTDWNIKEELILECPIGYVVCGNNVQIVPTAVVEGGGSTTSQYGEIKVAIYQ